MINRVIKKVEIVLKERGTTHNDQYKDALPETGMVPFSGFRVHEGSLQVEVYERVQVKSVI